MKSGSPMRSLRSVAAAIVAVLVSATAPSLGADMSKVLRTAYIAPETGFDPAASSDVYSDSVQRAIFDTLYGFDYLARPYRRVPRTAAAMPEITDGGRTWTMRVKSGIYFADDPAFKGKSASSSRTTTCTRGSGCSTPAYARLSRGTCRTRSSAPMRWSTRQKRADASTTTRESKGCRRSTAIPCV